MKCIFSLLLLFTLSLLSAAGFRIAENGKACAGILIPQNAKPIVKLAANELALYLQKITGAKFVPSEKSSFKNNIRIGFGNPAGLDKEEFIIRTSGKNLDIYGRDAAVKNVSWFNCYYDVDDKGSLQGVYYFLETLGVRWPAPGFDHVPQKKTLTVPALNIRFKPCFSYRNCNGGYNFVSASPDGREYVKNSGEFMRWQVRIGASSRLTVPGCHSERALGLYKDPKWIADKKRLILDKFGKRNPNYSCWTNPDVLKLWLRAANGYFAGKGVVESGFKYTRGPYLHSKWPFPFIVADEFMIDPMDNDGVNDGKCYCESCKKFRKENPCPDDSELMWRLIAAVAKDVNKKYPGKYITTLIYPPKRQVPNMKLPPNIRVKICQSGPKQCLAPASFKAEIQAMKDWKKITGNLVPLWTYHCVSHGNSMSNILETYPALIQKYAKAMRGLSSGMYMETHAVNFTRELFDSYMFMRIMRNPDLDLEKELDEYCKVYYGPAHAEARAFWDAMGKAFVSFWNQTVPKSNRPGLVTPWGYRNTKMQRKLWELVYTEKFLADMGKLVAAMEKKSAGTRYAKPVAMLKKFIYDDIVTERKLTFNREQLRSKIRVEVKRLSKAPAAADWKKAPANKLIQAKKFVTRLGAAGSFKMLADKKNLYFRAVLIEPGMKRALEKATAATRTRVWQDNAIELFFYSAKERAKRQIIISSSGIWSSNVRAKGKTRWDNMPGAVIKVKKQARSWVVEAALPLAKLTPRGGSLRFNMTRSRRVARTPLELSTWSYLAGDKGWHSVGNYGNIIFK